MKANHCCSEMRQHLTRNEIGLVFIMKFQEYGIRYLDGGSSFQEIKYCPWCGVELPKSMREAWFGEIEKLGLDPDDPKLPQRFQTDAWYKSI